MVYKLYNRKSTRLPKYDYSSPGMYYVTMCAQNRECLFGDVINDKIELNDIGEMVAMWWHELENKYPNIKLDKYIIMPNHIHGIIQIAPVGANLCIRPNWFLFCGLI